MKAKFLKVIAILALLSLVFTACAPKAPGGPGESVTPEGTPQGEPGGQPQPIDTLRVGIAAMINQFDPGYSIGIQSIKIFYNIFDTRTLLKSAPSVAISATSGAAGVAMWLSTKVLEGERVEKDDPRVLKLKEWVDEQYEGGRVTVIGTSELWQAVHLLNIV